LVQQSIRRISSSNIMSSASTLVSSPDVEQLDAMDVADTVPHLSGQSLAFAAHTNSSTAASAPHSGESAHNSDESKQQATCVAAPNGILPNPTQDEPKAVTKGEEEAVMWGRLRAYEAEEALAINRNLYTRQLRQTTLANDGAPTDTSRVPKLQDKFAPDGNLLFTGTTMRLLPLPFPFLFLFSPFLLFLRVRADRYIRRFQEEEERLKSEQMSWTRSLGTNTTAPASAPAANPHASYVGAKESDACDIERRANGTAAAAGDYYDEDDDAEAEGEAENDDPSSIPFSASSSSSSFAHMRSGISSVGSALRKKFPKVLSLASKKRTQQRRDKGKEASAVAAASASGAYGSPLLESAPWPVFADADALGRILPTPAYGTATAPRRVSGLGGHHHAARSTADDDSSLQPFKEHPASILAASSGAFDKAWTQDYSPFSPFAFDQPQRGTLSSTPTLCFLFHLLFY
jgi:hypothetical protein